MKWFNILFVIVQIILLLYLFLRFDLKVTTNKGKESKALTKYVVIFSTKLMLSVLIGLIFKMFHIGSNIIDVLSLSTGISILILWGSSDFESGFKINNREYKFEKKVKL